MTQDTQPIRLGMVGAGIFAREAHLPSLLQRDSAYEIRAIFSRTESSAQTAAKLIPYPVAITTDLDELLARDDIDAVNITVPIPQLPQVVRKALAAGKHVISEKPVAPDVTTGRALVHEYRTHYSHLHWMVGENWRYETAFLRAKEIIDSGAIGQVRLCHCTSMTRIAPDNRYSATDWRLNDQFPGGFILDAGVHHMALLRALMGEVIGVSAQTTQTRPDLPPADSVAATLHFDSGAIGVYLVSYAFDTPWQDWLQVTGDEGSLRVQRGRIELVTQSGENSLACQTYDGVQRELSAFADTLRSGEPHRNTPEEALCDLAAIEALLRAAETGETIAPATL